MRSIICLLILICAACSKSDPLPTPAAANPPSAQEIVSNPVAIYFDGAEIQAETDAQREQLRNALSDMLSRPVEDLKELRFSDYQGKSNAWSLPELLAAHVVPKNPQALDAVTLYAALEKPEARAAIRAQLNAFSSPPTTGTAP